MGVAPFAQLSTCVVPNTATFELSYSVLQLGGPYSYISATLFEELLYIRRRAYIATYETTA